MTYSVFLYCFSFLCIITHPLHAIDDSDDSLSDFSSSSSAPEMSDMDSAASDVQIDDYFERIIGFLTHNTNECFKEGSISNALWKDMEGVVNVITHTPQVIDKDTLESRLNTVENLLKSYCDANGINMMDPHTGDFAFGYGTFIEYVRESIQGMESDPSND